MVKIGILGGSGYGGSELLRILLFHPEARIELATAGEHAGARVDSAHPNLRGLTDLAFEPMPDPRELGHLDCVFLALPHGEALDIVPRLPRGPKIIDLSGDFRLDDDAAHRRVYGRARPAVESAPPFVYGLTEANRERIRAASRVSNPGCFATAVELALLPLISSGMARGKIIADMKTGSSGSGARPAAGAHHPRRSNSFFAYKILDHQHQPEVEQLFRSVDPEWPDRCSLLFQTHSMPLVRGIFGSIYAGLSGDADPDELRSIYREFYGNEFFVRLVEGSPDVNWVKGTNFVDVGLAATGDTAMVFVALDNLVKGAAGQAVQNMNLMFGIEERTGLVLPGSNP